MSLGRSIRCAHPLSCINRLSGPHHGSDLPKATRADGSETGQTPSRCVFVETLVANLVLTLKETEVVELQSDLLNTLSSYRDLYVTRTSLETQPSFRETLTLHALNHVVR